MCSLFDLIKDRFEKLRPNWKADHGWVFTNRNFNNERFYVRVWGDHVTFYHTYRDRRLLYASDPDFFDLLDEEIDLLRARGLLETHHQTMNVEVQVV